MTLHTPIFGQSNFQLQQNPNITSQLEMGLTWHNMIQPKIKEMGFDPNVINLVYIKHQSGVEFCQKVIGAGLNLFWGHLHYSSWGLQTFPSLSVM